MKYIITLTGFLGLLGLLIAPWTLNAQEISTETKTETAIFAAGCFWCIEKDMEKVKGVKSVVSGYTGGTLENPTYKQVGTQKTGHYEAVRVTYDPTVVSYEQLLSVFWRNHDPFDPRGQFCDKGASYRAAIFPLNEEQRAAAEKSLEETQKRFSIKIVTPILEAKTFYLAEGYHQDYYKKNPVRYKFYRWNCGRDQRLEEISKAWK